jgi:hypothetical protein
MRSKKPSGSRIMVVSALTCFLPIIQKYMITPIDASQIGDNIYSLRWRTG